MKDFLERVLAEIDRQLKQAGPGLTPEQALILTFAAQDTRDALIRLYGRKAEGEI